MDFKLTQEQEMLVEAVKSFVEKELLPYEEEVDRADAVSPELAAQIRGKALAAGFYAFNMPEEVGGGGLDYLSQALVERELSKVSWALHVFVARPSKILMACKGEQIEQYLLPCVQGEKIDCFALTEPGAGSDANSIKTRAVRDGDDFVLNGAKHFISHAGHADFAIVFAVTDTYEHNGKKRNAVTAFLVDKGTAGMTVRRGPKCVSNKGYHTYEIFFDDCRVPASKVLGEVDGEAGMAKLFASEVLGKVADETVQIFGGMGLMDEGPVERIWRNARIERIWEGTSEIQRHIISRELLRPLLR
ncbi:Crotonobetainyl-CoA dehydrogenase [compost metagenome]